MVSKSKEKIETAKNRPPIVVVLGHVDHGKSSLLEAIKDFKICAKESGGITQHIGAYEVEESGKKITFIDTPGHEAFSAMRARGTEVADIALLVIDAAQSVQPQTKEAIEVIKRAEIPMIVVLNKIDKPEADPEKIKRELSKINIFVESMGGQVPSVEVSAKEKTGIKELLEMILLVSEMKDLKSETDAPAEGLIIESYMDSGRGPVATAIVKKGILKLKDIISTDLAMAKIRSLQDFSQKEIKEAYPSQPVIILGFEKVPAVGEKFKTYKTAEEAQAKLKVEEKKREINTSILPSDSSKKISNVILKGDVFGSLEAIEGVLKNLPQEKVNLRILKSEVGDINETDVKLAEMSKAIIIGFRVKISPTVVAMMRKDISSGEKRVRIKTFDIIYELIQEVRNGMEKSLESEIVRKDVGKIKALVLFWAEKNRQIVGGKIQDGEIKKGLRLEVFRDDKKIGSGRIIELQRDKKVVEKLVKGDECGILFEGNTKIEKNDILVAFIEERHKSEL
jgi:translation initiation factor IF-2